MVAPNRTARLVALLATRLTKRLMKMAQRTELRDFLDICACFQGMSHNEPEHLEVVNRMLDTLARKQ